LGTPQASETTEERRMTVYFVCYRDEEGKLGYTSVESPSEADAIAYSIKLGFDVIALSTDLYALPKETIDGD
jgi:hypothetical protein